MRPDRSTALLNKNCRLFSGSNIFDISSESMKILSMLRAVVLPNCAMKNTLGAENSHLSNNKCALNCKKVSLFHLTFSRSAVKTIALLKYNI